MIAGAGELAALLEVARLQAWLRALAALAGPDAVGMIERAIEGEIWPVDERSQGTGVRRTGGLYR
jgi:hypothetical protein